MKVFLFFFPLLIELEKKTQDIFQTQIKKSKKHNTQTKIKNVWETTKEEGCFSKLHNLVKDIFTLKQNNYSDGKIDKIGFCKNLECKAQCKITLYGRSEEWCELFQNQYSHTSSCNLASDIFKNPDLIEYCKLNLKPSDIINKFNEKNKEKEFFIEDTEENRKKISKLKYNLKPNNEETKICNMKNLQDWFYSKSIANYTLEEIKALDWNQTTVLNYEIKNDQFAALISSKNLQLNLMKQLSVEKVCIGTDGTYKLSSTGHPTIVLGVYDVNRKFHLSKFINFI